jgi:hypothetical protein
MNPTNNPMNERYHSFLLRVWEISDLENRHWRFSIENTRTKEMVGFESLEKLIGHLRKMESENFDNSEDNG